MLDLAPITRGSTAGDALRNSLGTAARERVHTRFLGDVHLRRYAAMFNTLSTT